MSVLNTYRIRITSDGGILNVWHAARASNPDDALTCLEHRGKYNPATDRATKFLIVDSTETGARIRPADDPPPEPDDFDPYDSIR